ncbi:hypothetical protein SUDANB120_06265 (plasmid) [Streptomyces sp. enrichment culture]|uniref:hypothetical protein n=1 Tax=Streptomyces sp. enrichment culture TaxID=1795815 RepID=UPI003F54BFAD
MKRNVLRTAGVSAIAALALGIAVPAASAVTSASASPVGVVQTAGGQQLGSLPLEASGAPAASAADVAAIQQAPAADKIKLFIELLKRTGNLFSKAGEKAKAGFAAFNAWMGAQHWTVRAAWWALSGSAQTAVFNYFADLAS